MRRSSPCRAFGHTAGRDSALRGIGTCKECRRLRQAIRRGMEYWFRRIMLGESGRVAGAAARYRRVEVSKVYENRWSRRRYHALRSQGVAWDEALARRSGMSAQRVREIQRQNRRRRATRWGGDTTIGSAAWVRRETYRLAKKIGAG